MCTSCPAPTYLCIHDIGAYTRVCVCVCVCVRACMCVCVSFIIERPWRVHTHVLMCGRKMLDYQDFSQLTYVHMCILFTNSNTSYILHMYVHMYLCVYCT